MRVAAAVVSGQDPGPEASVGKLLATDTMARTSEVARLLLGPRAGRRQRPAGAPGRGPSTCSARPATGSPAAPTRSSTTSSPSGCSGCRDEPQAGADSRWSTDSPSCASFPAGSRPPSAASGPAWRSAPRPAARRALRADLPPRDRRRAARGQVGARRARRRSGGTTCCARRASWRRWLPPGCRCRPSSRPRDASRPGSRCSWSRASRSSRCSTTRRCRRRWRPPGCCARPQILPALHDVPLDKVPVDAPPLSPLDELGRWARTMAAVPPRPGPRRRAAARAARRIRAGSGGAHPGPRRLPARQPDLPRRRAGRADRLGDLERRRPAGSSSAGSWSSPTGPTSPASGARCRGCRAADELVAAYAADGRAGRRPRVVRRAGPLQDGRDHGPQPAPPPRGPPPRPRPGAPPRHHPPADRDRAVDRLLTPHATPTERGLPWTSSPPHGRATCWTACRCSWTSTSIRPRRSTTPRSPRRANRHEQPQVMRDLQAKARELGLWNLFMTHGSWGAGLTNLEYAPLMELAGRSIIGPEALNCSAPDTGNMEILAMYGTPEQQEQWLRAAAGLRDPLGLRDDRAGGRQLRRAQHHRDDPARGRRLRPQRPQVVHLRRPRPGLQADHLHGQVRPGRLRRTGSRA